MACSCRCSGLIGNNITRYRALGGAILGCCGNEAHTYGFHCPRCRIPSTDYSIRRSSGPGAPDDALAGDFGMNLSWSRKWLAWMVAQVKSGAFPEVLEIIGSLDGVRPLYWARWEGWAGRAYTGGGHVGWAHVSGDRAKGNLDSNWFVGWPMTGGVPIPAPGPVVVSWREVLVRDLPVLRRGFIGRPAKKVQASLNAHIGAGLAEDGDFGGNTQRAVIRFQGNKGLDQDGIVGANTWRALGVGMPTLKRGSSGQPVEELQALLNLWGAGLREDSDFGSATESALKAIQRGANLAGGADGVAGQASWSYLLTQ